MHFYTYMYDNQSMLKSLRALKAYFLLLCFFFSCNSLESTSPYHLAEVLDFSNAFSESSDLSVIMLSCGGKRKLQLTIKSFLYFNTYPIKKFHIVHCSLQPIPLSSMLPFGYDSHKQVFEVTGATNEEYGIIQALSTVYQKINTKYVYQTDAQWLMTKGFGFVQKSISILKQSVENSMKVSQVVTNYPYWRTMARLSQMKWTKTGYAYHEILAFAPQRYSYFTLSPSVMQFQTLYYILKGAGMKKMCSNSQCKAQAQTKYQYDKCCLWQFGQSISKMGYSQVYLNDGTGQPNHQFIPQ